jgi:hypothetical protein
MTIIANGDTFEENIQLYFLHMGPFFFQNYEYSKYHMYNCEIYGIEFIALYY